MTEPIAVDVPAKPQAGLPSKPAASAVPVAVNSATKSEPAKAAASSSATKLASAKPPAAGTATLLERLGRNKAGIAAAALFSLAAGIAGVHLIAPGDDPAPTADTARQPAASEPINTAAAPKPTVTIEAPTSTETIPSPNLPTTPASGEPNPLIPGGPIAPGAPPPPAAGDMGGSSVVIHEHPTTGSSGGSMHITEPGRPAKPAAGSSLPAIVPVVGTPPAGTSSGGTGAIIPPLPSAAGGGGSGGPMAPAKPGETGDPPPPALDTAIIIPAAGNEPPKNDEPKLPQLPGTPTIGPKAGTLPRPEMDPSSSTGVVLPKVPLPDPAAAGIPMPPAKEPDKKEGEKKVQGYAPNSAIPKKSDAGDSTSPGSGASSLVSPLPPPHPPGGSSSGAGTGTTGGATTNGSGTSGASGSGTSGTLAVPPPKMDVSGTPAKFPASTPGAGAGSGTRLDFNKPAGGAAAVPVASKESRPTTTYDEDIYMPKSGDSWESISREFYSDPRYAAALSEYNRRVLARGTPVNVPPIHIVKSYLPVNNAVTPASGNFGSSSAPDWGTASPQPAARGGVAKPFVVPTGGMSMRGVARLTLGTEQRWNDIYILNPHLKPDQILAAGTELKLPPEARLP